MQVCLSSSHEISSVIAFREKKGKQEGERGKKKGWPLLWQNMNNLKSWVKRGKKKEKERKTGEQI